MTEQSATTPDYLLFLDHAQIGPHRARVVGTKLELRHVRMARRNSSLEHARKFVKIDFATEYAKWRCVRVPAFAFSSDCMAAPAEFRDQRLAMTDRILRLRDGTRRDQRDMQREDGWHEFHSDIFIRESGAPEGIRTPDPQIRSLVLYPAELPAPLEEKGGAPEEIRTPDPQIRSLVLYPAELRALDSAAGNRTTAPRHSYRLDPPLARVCTPYARAACAAQANASFSMRIR